MKKLDVYEPAMCCSTGVCGPSVDPKLVQFAQDVRWLEAQGATVNRYNLAQSLQAFADSSLIRAALEKEGNKALPAFVMNDAILLKGRYPSRDELAQWFGIGM
ncbi:arsenite efflux transporter metallochaperone ArsD [Heliobacterium undosum]|uniref:Arsenite efflux transporter metallochaperone ArsD n=1 Tax=Heliomicrobium undosum TaxID=121734 RepID=A0A845L2J3_9FIRM|nr:arsenite efflux transporter metallochaperone ArsD [Heliomicrobium undosum]MZP29225.1 arsenite efflux transporter metallochaperone ArsD [Heliomicrobium undosum]